MAGDTSTLITFNKISNGNRRGAVSILGVILPFPREVKLETAYDWQTEELGQIGSALRSMGSSLGSVDYTSSGIKTALSNLKDKILSTDLQSAGSSLASGLESAVIAGAAGVAGGDGLAPAALSGAGIAVNPKEEVLFKGVKHRNFALTFDLAPLTRADSVATMKFLTELHKFAAPELIANDAFFKYPGTLDITIMGTDGVVLDRGNCAITGIDCNMTPDSVWSTFENGKPVHIMLTINFVELTLPTKDTEADLFG